LLAVKSYGQVDTVYFNTYNDHISNLIDNGNYELAQVKADSMLIISKKLDYKPAIAEAYNLKGIIDRDQSNLRDALDNYLQALKLFEDLKLPTKVAGIQNNIGLIYAEIKEYRTALSYYFKAEAINVAGNKKNYLAINYNNIATCYQKLKQYSSALIYLNKSLALRQEKADTVGMAMAYHNIGINHQLTGDKDSALYFFHKSLGYLYQMDPNIGHAYNYLELGNTLLQQGKLNDAEAYLLQALTISENSELEGVKVEVYKYLSELYRQKNDFKKAFTFQDLYMSLKETVESDESKNEILKKELEYAFNQKQELQRIEANNKQAVYNAEIRSQKKLTMYAIIGLVVLSVLVLIVLRSYNQKRKSNFIISKQKEIVEHKNKEILDSITYAKYIQNALLPSDKAIEESGVKCFVLFKPKDIVSGDFYWIHRYLPLQGTLEGETYIAAVDCTGHGVPGALVSVVGNNGLNRCVKEFGIHDTGKILDKLSELVEETFAASVDELKDGMDISLLKIYTNKASLTTKVQWSGANNPLWIVRKNSQTVEEIKANKQPIGKYADRTMFLAHDVHLAAGDRLFLFTDGFADQFGGPNGKKFKYKQLEEALVHTRNFTLADQKAFLIKQFEDWKTDHEQVDDVCLIGIEI
jgi:serine phosphatase RsbU (regulator of sigma subunit)